LTLHGEMKKYGIGRGMFKSIVLTVGNTKKKLVRRQSPPQLLLTIIIMIVKGTQRSCN